MKEEIEKILDEEIAGTHLFPVEITVKNNRADVYLDADAGVNIAECAMLSRRLHSRLEEKGIDTGKYIIDISSPGIDRPLTRLREYKKNVGRTLQLRNKQNKILKGLLVYVDDETFMLRMGAGPKAKLEKLSYNQVTEAKVTI